MSDVEHFLYVFAKFPGHFERPVKVGITRNISSRLSTIQTSCPFKVGIAWAFACPNKEIAESIERMFHETQRQNQLYGEWFDFAPLEAIHIICLAYRVSLEHNCKDTTIHDPWLEKAGVLAAESRFSLLLPSRELQ